MLVKLDHGASVNVDNLKYITSVNQVLEESYPDVKHKVEIQKVDVTDKPESGLLEEG